MPDFVPLLDVHFDIFDRRFIRPAMDDTPALSLEELAQRHGLTAKQAANRCKVVRHHFRRLLLEEVQLTVMDDEHADEEVLSLTSHLQRQGA